MKWILPLIFSLTSFNLFSQQIYIKGIISDAETGEGVSFAHIGICEKSIGTVANDNGIYEFHIPDNVLNDTLCVSAIGYETFKFPVINLKGLTNFDISLNPQTSYLDDILIKDERITARRVVRKAIARINKNYPKKPFNLEGYYRDYLNKNNEYISFLEGAFTVDDRGFRQPTDKTLIKINQLRYSKDYTKYLTEYVTEFQKDSTKLLMHGVSPAFRGNEFSNLYYHNPIRNHSISVPFIGIFDTFSERNYDLEIDYYTYVDDKEVYVINISPSKKFRFTHVSIKGKLFIRTDNLAIVKFNYAYFVTKRLETKKWFELNVEYREFENKMYLKYFSFMNYFKLLTIEEIAEMAVFREFFVNDIHVSDYKPLSPDETIDETLPLHLQNAPNDKKFWINFNRTLLEQPLME
ncbi:MAG: carboxypeptidase-like regulatory domain-containing protein [Cyclobacteriaceae bacterium]|nr:carboxypeptidase-like regulatory domain-containing protein [Cyclobacteriaceae bacterium]MCK5370496.1 carboxypeptidase-like regulatory domain-containing protein [Cyclobacteriaceae bacterium]MCK5469861.1 carboxypeptidase-like regulatory domain-containing protein [Cyclobacteriaceae bacterium]